MRCPRCNGGLTTYTVEASDRSAVVCESCGFAGVPASHRPERTDDESWEQAVEQFDRTALPPERTCRIRRTEGVTPPTADTRSAIDLDQFEESVAVATALRGGGSGSDGNSDDSSNSSDGAADDPVDGSRGPERETETDE